MNRYNAGTFFTLHWYDRPTYHHKHHCFDFFSLLISQTFCYGAFRARGKEAVPVKKKKQHKYEFLPLHSQIFPLLRPPNRKHSLVTTMHRTKTYTLSSSILAWTKKKKTSPELDRPRPASKPTATLKTRKNASILIDPRCS